MNIVSTNMTIADFCQAIERRELIVNREYQRSEKVWPAAARSFLIESVLLGYPMPKLSLYQVTDLKSRKTYKEIVDGQQRTMALFEYYHDKYKMSGKIETEELAGKSYSELEDSYKQKFIDYALSIDIFVGATPDEVREVFRRMNSYNVPLNPEEQRHASYQGEFKWYVYRLGRRFDTNFLQMGVFRSQQLVRMADAKLITELSHALLYGISTTNKRTLDSLFKEKDGSFPEKTDLEHRLTSAFDYLIEWNDIHNGPLMKPHIVYSLVLAITHLENPSPALQCSWENGERSDRDRSRILRNLSILAESLANPEQQVLRDFVSASLSGGTNVREKRERRFIWFCRALSAESF